MKHAKMYLALIVTAVVLLSNIPLSVFGDIEKDENQAAVGTASNCGQTKEDLLETNIGVGSASDAQPDGIGKEPGNRVENGLGNQKPEQTPGTKAEGVKLLAADVSAEDMYSFDKSTGTINGFAAKFLSSLTPGDDGYCYVDLVIPEEIDGVPVTTVGEQAFYAGSKALKDNTVLKIRSLDLSAASNLKVISQHAFSHAAGSAIYSEMEPSELVLPDGLTHIGLQAFTNLPALTGDLILPDSIISIEDSAFKDDSGFNGTLKLSSACTKISKQTFKNCKFTGILEIPENVTLIEGNFAFSGNDFDTVIMNGNLSEIGGSAFMDCKQLKVVKAAGAADSQIRVSLPQSLTTMGNNLFSGCSKLEGSVIIPESVEMVGNNMFEGTNIKTIYVSGNETIVYPNHFLFNTGVNALIFPSKELFEKNIASWGSQSNLCTYPMTVSFINADGSIAGTRDALYNRPIGYVKNPETLVWEQEDPFALPPVPGASVGYDSGWTFQEGQPVATAASLVTGEKMVSSVSLSQFTFVAKEVKKVYDGQPAYLEVKAVQPITEVDASYYLYYFLGKGMGFDDIVYSGRNPIHYGITDAETGWYTVQIQFKKSGVSKSIYNDTFTLYVDIQKASALPVPPLYNSTPEPGTLLADISLTLPEDAPSGTIRWQNPNQAVTLGTGTYDWIYTPDHPENFTTDTILGTAEITGTIAPAVTGITITPAKAEVKKGEDLQFHADIEGTNSPSQAVIWSVNGAAAKGTQINSAGLLTVDSDEVADTLIVTATSAADPTFQASAAVTLINLPPEPDPKPDPDPMPEPEPEPTPDPVPEPEPATFSVTFNSMGGSTVSPITGIKSGSTITLPIVQRAGYRFDGWFSKESGGSRFTQQTPVTEDWILYAHWTLIKEQNSNNTADDDDDEPTAPNTPAPTPSENSKVEAGVREDGKAAATVTTDVVKNQIEKALQSAKQNTSAAAPVNVDIQVTSKETNPDALAVTLPLDVMTQLITSRVDNVDITIDKPDIAIRLNLAAIQEMKQQANSGVQIEARRINAAPFSEEVRSAAGNRPMFDLTATAMADQKNITNFGLGEAVVSIPYELQQGETAEDMVAIYIDPSGKVEYLEQSYYDATAKAVVFRTSHFSVYGIGKRPAAGQNGKGGSTQTYIVRRNDNLWKIANLFHCSIKELVELNNIKNPDIIITGSQLLIPQP